MHVEDPGSPEERSVRALLWETGATSKDLAAMATLTAVAYRTHNVLRHRRAGQPPLDVDKLFLEALRALPGPPAAKGLQGATPTPQRSPPGPTAAAAAD